MAQDDNEKKMSIVTWGSLTSAITLALSVGGVLISLTFWVYRELNYQREMVTQFRVEVAQQYVSAQALREVEQRSAANKAELSEAIKDMSARFDKSFDRLDKHMSDLFHAKGGG